MRENSQEEKIVKTVFFCTYFDFFEIALTVVYESVESISKSIEIGINDLSRTDAPSQGKDKSNGNNSFL